MPLIRNSDGNVFANTSTAYDNVTPSTNPIEARKNDLLRITEWLKSPAGLKFAGKQALLRTTGNLESFSAKDIANAAGRGTADAASAIAIILAQVPLNGTGTHFLFNELSSLAFQNNSFYTGNRNASNEANYRGVVTIKKSNKVQGNRLLDAEGESGYGFGRAGGSDTIGLSGINEEVAKSLKSDLLPVAFKIVGEPDSTIVFRGFIQGLISSYNPSWSPVNYVGRGEPLYTYTSTARTLGFMLQIPIFSKEEQHPTYQKLNSLISHTYPKYVNNLPQGTITAIRIGDYINQYGVITSMTDTVDTDVPWSSNDDPKEPILLPQVIKLQLSMNIIHDKLPQRFLGEDKTVKGRPFIAHGRNLIIKDDEQQVSTDSEQQEPNN
jgi:hypothetical protein